MKITNLFAEDTLIWKLFPQHSYVREMRALAFKMLTKAAASVYQLLQLHHSQYPIALWLLLGNPEHAARVRATPTCLKDPFTKELERMFDMSGGAVAEVLESVAAVCQTDISQVECRHASIRRTIHTKSVQTWRQGLTNASAHWMLQNARLSVHGTSKQNRQKKIPVKVLDRGVKAKQRKAPRGGAWRAFIRMASCNESGSPDLKQLAIDYNAMMAGQSQQELLPLCTTLGKMATMTGKKKDGDAIQGSAFGLTKRQHQCKTMDAAIEALAVQMSVASLQDQAMAVKRLAQNLKSIDASTVAKKMNMKVAAMKRSRDREVQSVLAEFKTQIGEKQVADMLDALPELQTLDGWQYESIPSWKVNIFKVMSPVADDAVKAIAWSVKNPQSGIASNISKCWEEMHTTMEPEVCQSIHDSSPEVETECYKRGFCVCKSAGKRLKMMLSRFHKLLKLNFRQGDMRDAYLSGSVLIKFYTVEETITATLASSSCHSASSGSQSKHVSATWLSIPLVYLKPYRVTCHLVHECSDPEPWLHRDDTPVLYVEVCIATRSMYFFHPCMLLALHSPEHLL
eukprot:6478289-Amphidinium_carterae.3